MDFPPTLSPLQRTVSSRRQAAPPAHCVVTGGTGFVGQRLVEMLVERGAERVVSFDIVPPPADAWQDARIQYVVGDISDEDAVMRACEGAQCVWHLAAIVGPFHPRPLYDKVNYHGTLNVISACRAHGISKLVMSSSPSTRFTGADIDGLSVDELPSIPMKSYMQIYAETKAKAELAARNACSDSLLTVAIAPHQVYGPRDNLFMPNILEAAGTGKLRIFSKPSTGYGKNRVCFTHVDNYCHALIIGEKALYKDSPALGKFYVVTDGSTHTYKEGYGNFWDEVDKTVVLMGFTSLWTKFKLPYALLMFLAYICNIIGWILGTTLKLNPFNVKMLTIHRWFSIKEAEQDLQYTPIVSFDEGWSDMGDWFKANWLPKFQASSGLMGISSQSQRKIDIQAKKTR